MNESVMQFKGVARIAGTGSYLPDKVVTNEDLVKKWGLEMSPEKITKVIGAELRHVAAPHERCSDLAYKASTRALDAAGITPQDLDLIIVVGNPGDAQTPEVSSRLRVLLGLEECLAFDVRMACTGWMAGVQIALLHMEKCGYRNVLVAAAAILSRETNWGKPLYSTIFGDAGGAVVLTSDTNAPVWYTSLWCGGTKEEGALSIWHGLPGISISPTEEEGMPQDYHGNFYMRDRERYFKTMEERVAPAVRRLFGAMAIAPQDIDLAFVHWPSEDLCEKGIECFQFPRDKVVRDLDKKVGNIIAAEMPLKLDHVVRDGRLQRGHRVVMADYGAGFTVGVMGFIY